MLEVWECRKLYQLGKKWSKGAKITYVIRRRHAPSSVRVLFNKVKKNTVLGRLIEESAKQVGAPVIPTHLSARECYQHAIGQGWSALDAHAREEVLQLAVSLMALGK